MKNPNSLIQLPLDSIQEKLDQNNKLCLRKAPDTPQGQYVHQIVGKDDWVIEFQPIMTLPVQLTSLISLNLKEEGNALIEETRTINNAYAGLSFKKIETLCISDIEIEDLKSRVAVWAEHISEQVTYKLRYRAKEDPYTTYLKAFDNFICRIDQKIAFGSERMYQMVWADALSQIPYILLINFFVKPKKFFMEYDDEFFPVGRGNLPQRQQKVIGDHFNLYGVESTQYSSEIVLAPLLAHLKLHEMSMAVSDMQKTYFQCYGDILEAFPYLFTSERRERYMFSIPGANFYGVFSFLVKDGLGHFYFCNSESDLRKGLESNSYRGGLLLGWDAKLSFIMHPWLTLERHFNSQDALLLATWLIQQIHPIVVSDYLKIEKYYLRPQELEHLPSVMDNHELDHNYIQWVREVRTNEGEDAIPATDCLPTQTVEKASIPQIRRSLFFKILSYCGVRVEQGKGSELKLLRDGKHPFRLGNHYGPNPTIPSFIAIKILQRMEITHVEWESALQAIL